MPMFASAACLFGGAAQTLSGNGMAATVQSRSDTVRNVRGHLGVGQSDVRGVANGDFSRLDVNDHEQLTCTVMYGSLDRISMRFRPCSISFAVSLEG